MTKLPFDGERLNTIYPGCLDSEQDVWSDSNKPLIGPDRRPNKRPAYPTYSSFEANISIRGLVNHLGIVFVGSIKRTGSLDRALDDAGLVIYGVDDLITHARRSQATLGKIYNPETDSWFDGSAIKASEATIVLTEFLLAQESYFINKLYPQKSEDRERRLMDMFDAVQAIDEVKLHDMCRRGRLLHAARVTILKGQLDSARHHRVTARVINRERLKRKTASAGWKITISVLSYEYDRTWPQTTTFR